jgi:hypothetical protein
MQQENTIINEIQKQETIENHLITEIKEETNVSKANIEKI